jgi:hypothetical protein
MKANRPMNNHRLGADAGARIDPHRAQHLSLTAPPPHLEEATRASFNDFESPLLWLARRKGPDGKPLISVHHLQAGERLRADFTAAQMMPRTTANWEAPIARRGRGGEGASRTTERAIDARRRTRLALREVGPEFADLLLDVCCFLKRLDDVERERRWPQRSAKVILQLALDRLARHYGFGAHASGRLRADVRVWLAEDAVFESG